MRESVVNLCKGIAKHLINIPGWHTNRKIVVIESDDWGGIRMPSRVVYERCLSEGYRVDLNPFERYDSLASQDDLELLFDLLSSFKDKKGNHPIITANCVVANPDFDKIKRENFRNYYFESVIETFQKYPAHAKNFDLWLDGKNSGVFYPQFHAREHLNVSKFMKGLQQNDRDVRFAFENQMPGCIRKTNSRSGNYFVEATNFDSETDKKDKLNIYTEGLDIFEKLFGYKSLSIIPPNYTWCKDYNEVIASKGVKYIQGFRKMREPVLDKNPVYYKRMLGETNEHGQLNLIRNCSFEPSWSSNIDEADCCLSDLSIAFRMHKPAIICSHRINFTGYIDTTNRDRNLSGLKRLISTLLRKWPDIEFMTSEKLGALISESNA